MMQRLYRNNKGKECLQKWQLQTLTSHVQEATEVATVAWYEQRLLTQGLREWRVVVHQWAWEEEAIRARQERDEVSLQQVAFEAWGETAAGIALMQRLLEGAVWYYNRTMGMRWLWHWHYICQAHRDRQACLVDTWDRWYREAFHLWWATARGDRLCAERDDEIMEQVLPEPQP